MSRGFALLPRPKPELIFKALPDGGLIFSPDHEVYFSLNAVSAVVWTLLPPAMKSFEELVDHLSRAYPEVTVDVIREDVQDLLHDFLKNELVEVVAD